jgi:CRP/FNR family transcriptional regulator, cyclic AMP receptor protein
VQGLSREDETGGKLRSPSCFDKLEVAVFGDPIEFVADDGGTFMGEVDADLVHAAGGGKGADEGVFDVVVLEPVADAEGCAGGSALGVDALFYPDAALGDGALAEDGGIGSPFVAVGPSKDEGVVRFGNLVSLHALVECARGGEVFCHEGEAAGFAVEAVDDADLAAVGEFVGKECAEFVPEGVGVAGFAGVDLHKGRFIHDEEVRRFIDDAGRIRRAKAGGGCDWIWRGISLAQCEVTVMPPRHPVHDKLKACPIFRDFDDSELAALLELAEPTVYAVGKSIVKQGEQGSAMYLMADGAADVLLHSEGRETVRLSSLKAGDFFGELSLFDHEPRSADVTAVTECTALKITMGLLRMFSAESPNAAFKLTLAVLEAVGRRLRAANRKYLDTLAIVSALASNGTIMEPDGESVLV